MGMGKKEQSSKRIERILEVLSLDVLHALQDWLYAFPS